MKRRQPLSFVLGAAGFAVLLGALAGCGQRGPLTLPGKPAASSAAKPGSAPSASAPATQ